MTTSAICPYQDNCSGCDLLGTPYSQQRNSKIESLQDVFKKQGLFLPEIEYIECGDFGSRDRLDFTLKNNKLGLYNKFSREVVDIEKCLQLSEDLQLWLTDFRKITWPIKVASFRLRVGPTGNRGLWIDCANIDVKALLDEKTTLVNLINSGVFIEIGQKGKHLAQVNGEFKLKEALPQYWFSTSYLSKEVPLYSLVSSFTQPSIKSNRLISQLISDWVLKTKAVKLIEFGAGIGNLSLPAMTSAKKIIACEYDKQALDCFKASAQELKLEEQIVFNDGDFQRKSQDLVSFDTALVNPPRSGLQNFTTSLLEKNPEHIIYMSCYAETMATDILRMKHNYSIDKISILDQFPQTKHFEVFALLKRN